jgi:hypothetical protein
MFKIYRYLDDDLNFDSVQSPKDQLEDDGLDSEEFDTDLEDDFDSDSLELEDETEEKEEDPDFQGIIRTVPGACLVYKRKTENNSYEELWVYNAGGRDIAPEIKVRNSILAGTDIDPKLQRSPEGDQTCDTTTVGNVQFLKIRGLVN